MVYLAFRLNKKINDIAKPPNNKNKNTTAMSIALFMKPLNVSLKTENFSVVSKLVLEIDSLFVIRETSLRELKPFSLWFTPIKVLDLDKRDDAPIFVGILSIFCSTTNSYPSLLSFVFFDILNLLVISRFNLSISRSIYFNLDNILLYL